MKEVVAELLHFYPSIDPEKIFEYPTWMLTALIENLPVIRAKEELVLAQIVGIFTKQVDKKNVGKQRARINRFVRKRRKIIQRMTAIPKKEIEREKIDFDLMDENEKEEFRNWLNGVGIKHG